MLAYIVWRQRSRKPRKKKKKKKKRDDRSEFMYVCLEKGSQFFLFAFREDRIIQIDCAYKYDHSAIDCFTNVFFEGKQTKYNIDIMYISRLPAIFSTLIISQSSCYAICFLSLMCVSLLITAQYIPLCVKYCNISFFVKMLMLKCACDSLSLFSMLHIYIS